MNKLQNWFSSLQRREQTMVSATAIFLLVTLFFLIVWEPLFTGIDEQRARLAIQKKTLSWMQQAAQQVSELKQSGTTISSAVASSSLNTLTERSTISAGIRTSVDKMESSGSDELKVQFKQVDFNRFIQWLGNLQNSYGIVSKSVSINNSELPGQVSARVTLQKVAL